MTVDAEEHRKTVGIRQSLVSSTEEREEGIGGDRDLRDIPREHGPEKPIGWDSWKLERQRKL